MLELDRNEEGEEHSLNTNRTQREIFHMDDCPNLRLDNSDPFFPVRVWLVLALLCGWY